MVTEIYVENQRVDVSGDISSLLTFALDDVKDFASRQTTFSQTIVLPGTANNNKLFGYIFDFGSNNIYDKTQVNINYNFNAAKSANCIIFQDNLQTFQGSLRMMQINVDKGRIEYEVAVFGNLSLLNVKLAPTVDTTVTPNVTTGLLENLDFSAYNHTFNETNIIASWDAARGSGYYYPLMDYGNYSILKHDWQIGTFRPALYAKEIIDKMFTAAGFTYSCDLFNSTRFKNIIVPFNQKNLTRLTTLLFSATRSNSSHVIDSGTSNPVRITFGTVTGTLFTATNSNGTFTYNGTATVAGTITASVTGTMVRQSTTFKIEVRKNGTLVGGTQTIYASNGSSSPVFYSYSASFANSIAHNDYYELYIYSSFAVSGSDYAIANPAGLGANSTTPISAPIAYGDSVVMNEIIPKNIKQIDFFTSIVKMFNLYVFEDKYTANKLIIKPFNTDGVNSGFFSTDSLNAVDWTYKLNRDKPIQIRPMAELTSKVYNFQYTPDSDYWNDLYKKSYNQAYGDYRFNTQNEFSTAENNLQVIFSGTPLLGYAGEDKIYSTIFKRTGNSPNYVEESTDSALRLLQVKKITGVSSWNLLGNSVTGQGTISASTGSTSLSGIGTAFLSQLTVNAFIYVNGVYIGKVASITNDGSATLTANSLYTVSGTAYTICALLSNQTAYGYAGHLDDPNAPSNDLNFGVPGELFFTLVAGNLTGTQFNVYWSSYMAEITNKDSKIITANFYLKPIDIYNLDMSKYVNVDGVLFRINKIIDYNATAPGDCKVELIRVLNTSY